MLDGGLTTATYVHNALGQRTKKTVGGTDVIYLYDLAGNLLAEHDATGAMIRDYVWMNGAPVAQIDQGEVFNYLHVDHLNTPRLATDDSQTVVWRWDSDAFGTTLADEDPDGDLSATTVNLRFPGQYFDQETGFHYNYFRTYDPSTGRYVESDPIGVAGGVNTFSYSSNAPTTTSDRYGLCPWCGPLVPIVTTGARPAPIITPRQNPISQAVRRAVTEAERANPASRYNQRRIDQIFRENGIPPRLRPEQMVESVESCPLPPRIRPGTGRENHFEFWSETINAINKLKREGLVDHSPVPIVPNNQLWPAGAVRSMAPAGSTGVKSTDESWKQCERAGLCI